MQTSHPDCAGWMKRGAFVRSNALLQRSCIL